MLLKYFSLYLVYAQCEYFALTLTFYFLLTFYYYSADGIACKGNTTVVTYCGECGIMSSSSYVTGAHLAGNQ